MKNFFTVLILLGVLGFAALNLSVVGTMVYVLGIVAAIIALLLAVQERQQRIEEKLDRLLAACAGEEALAGEEAPRRLEDLPLCKEMLEDGNA